MVEVVVGSADCRRIFRWCQCAGVDVDQESTDNPSLSSGCSSMVELQLPKLVTWVRFPSPAPTLNALY